jgi:CRISP-associated protein Cas1
MRDVNAMLNYTYEVLDSLVHIATIIQGLNPTIGYLHTCRPRRAALVYDRMEPLRTRVDRLVLSFVPSYEIGLEQRSGAGDSGIVG